MKTTILDTDFIINCIKNKIDIETSIKTALTDKTEICIIDKTLEELKNKPLEKLATKFISKFKIIKTKNDKTVDNLIMDLVKNNQKIIVATQDKNLKEKLKNRKIPVITIRQQKYLILT